MTVQEVDGQKLRSHRCINARNCFKQMLNTETRVVEIQLDSVLESRYRWEKDFRIYFEHY